MKLRTTIAAAALALISASSFAQAPARTATPRIDARQTSQEARIQQGVNSGQLNARETARLDRGQAAIARAEARAKADGTVTPQERQHLKHMQNKASKNIRQQKHDAQTARGR